MKKLITSMLLLAILNSSAQIGGGWDWAFNTGCIGGASYKHLKYSPDGSEILMGGQASAAAYFGNTTLTAPIQFGFPGSIKFLGKINAATGVPTILRSFINFNMIFDCITTDNAGNFYVGGGISSLTPYDFGNGVTITAQTTNKAAIIKFDASGTAVWAKTFQLGVSGTAGLQLFKLAVSNAGNIFFWGFNPNSTTSTGPSIKNYPLYKLDSNGNTLWFKDALNSTSIGQSNYVDYLKDKFIDDEENVHLFVLVGGTSGFTFEGIAHPGGNATYGGSTLISLNASGTVTKAQTYSGGVSHFQVNRTNGNLAFNWGQIDANPAPFQNVPHFIYQANGSASYANSFSGMVETDKIFNYIKCKELFANNDNPFSAAQNGNKLLSLPNGKLLIEMSFAYGINYSVGTNSFYPAEATNFGSAIIETDTNWRMSKFITGGKAPGVSQDFITAYNDTYLIAAGFSSATSGPTATDLPTTTFGTVTLTGMNAATNLTTAYGQFSSFRTDVALAQCKSGNFPTIASTTWLGTTTNWNTPSNWSNGVPTSLNKAVFNGVTPNYPTISTNPTAATLEVTAGTTVNLPPATLLLGGLKNEGTIILNNAGFFQGLGANEWLGSGNINFTGTSASLSYGNTLTNSLILSTDFTTYSSLNIPKITFNSGKFNLSNKRVTITNTSPTAVSGTSPTSYFYGGTLERNISNTGNYEFAVGTSTNFQSASINANNLIGTTAIATTFTTGAITGTTPATTLSGVAINSALNAGWYTITPNNQPTSGNYDVTLKLQNATNSVPVAGKYTIIKRNDAASPWAVQGNFTLASILSNTVTASNTGLNSFSDFAIGIGAADIALGTNEFENNILKLNLYPNPTADVLNFETSNAIEKGTLKIISLTGQTVFEQQNMLGNNFNINVSGLNSGLYLIQLSDANGNYNSKFVKN